MTGKRKNALPSDFSVVKRSRKSVSLEIKYKIIKLADSGLSSNTEIARKLEIPRTTVVTILKDKARILEEVKCQAPMQTKYIRRRGKKEYFKIYTSFILDIARWLRFI
jgi:DNA invertase Pin-like site-specific DNA recombinase